MFPLNVNANIKYTKFDFCRKTTSITVVIDNIIERQLWDDAEEEQRREAVCNMEQPYVIKQREAQECRHLRVERQKGEKPHGREEINKLKQPFEDGDLNKLGTSYESCRFSPKRQSNPVLKKSDFFAQREGVNTRKELNQHQKEGVNQLENLP